MSNIPWYEKISRCIQAFTGEALAWLRVKPIGEQELVTSGVLTLAVGLGAVAQNLDLEYDPAMPLDAIGDYMVVIYNPSATVALSVAIQGNVDVVGSANPQYFNLATGTVAAATTARFMVPGLFSSNGARVAITPAIGVDLAVEVFVYRGLSTQPVDIVVTGEVSIPDEVDVTFNGTMTVVEEAEANTVVGSGNIAFGAVNLTTEIIDDALALPAEFVRGRRDLWQIHVESPGATASELTINVYNVTTINATPRNVLAATFTPGAGAVFVMQNIEGLFTGDGTIKVGADWSADTADEPTVYYKVFRV